MAAEDIRLCQYWMDRGVLIRDFASTFIDSAAKIGRGTVIEPFSFIQGNSKIGRHCRIGPFARLKNATLGDRSSVEQSVVEDSKLGKRCSIGPWARLRPGCVVGDGAHLGNFCEFKKAKIGKGVKAGHLSYLGDAVVGDFANIGAGTITANFDGKKKNLSRIGKKAFTGSGTVLVAPVSIGDFAMTGAGAVVLKKRNVPRRGVAVGVPARNISRPKS
jgi:bifunctional UDP-N-acetylglucosamine pyrophosphorylase/glucosamine-1-phosphate N-acetyltransferase